MKTDCSELFKHGKIAFDDMNKAIAAAVIAHQEGDRSGQLKAERDFRQARGKLMGLIVEYNGRHCGSGDLMGDITGKEDKDPSGGDSRIPQMPKL